MKLTKPQLDALRVLGRVRGIYGSRYGTWVGGGRRSSTDGRYMNGYVNMIAAGKLVELGLAEAKPSYRWNAFVHTTEYRITVAGRRALKEATR